MPYTPPAVEPPAPLPVDVDDVTAQALAVLRLDASDDDAGRVRAAAGVAVDLAGQQLDAVAYTVPPDLALAITDAVVTLTVELYRRKDAPFGVTDSWSVDGAVLRLSSDVMRGVRSQLAKYRQRWAVA